MPRKRQPRIGCRKRRNGEGSISPDIQLKEEDYLIAINGQKVRVPGYYLLALRTADAHGFFRSRCLGVIGDFRSSYLRASGAPHDA
jgi:hypothetical protein